MRFSDQAVAWRDACRRAVARHKQLLAADITVAARGAATSVGAGGDMTLALDREFEEIVLEELTTLGSSTPGDVHVVSEELGDGAAGPATAATWVIVDPIDGSTNMSHGLPCFSLSVAVASGSCMGDVWFAYVFDFGAQEEFVCERGHTTELNGRPVPDGVDAAEPLVGFESAEPMLVMPALAPIAAAGVKEIRVIGSIAVALCYVGLGRLSGLLTCGQCRSVDAAAAQLFATELGTTVRFDGEPPARVDLRLSARYRLVASRGALLDALASAQRAIPLIPR